MYVQSRLRFSKFIADFEDARKEKRVVTYSELRKAYSEGFTAAETAEANDSQARQLVPQV